MLRTHGYKGIDKNAGNGRRTSTSGQCRSPMYPASDVLYMDVKKILRSAWEAKAAREGKTIERVAVEEVRHAIELGADARLGQQVKKSILGY